MTVPSLTVDPMIAALANFRDPTATDWEDAWVGMEPTFQSKKSVRKWQKMAGDQAGEDAYFLDRYMLRKQRKIARAIRDRYEDDRKQGLPHAMFSRVVLEDDLDQWKVRRQNLRFHWEDKNLEPLVVRFSLDPETFEYSIKPVPLSWLYDERFVTFLDLYVWQVPLDHKLQPYLAHGGAQFSFSVKTFLTGSLLADDIATKLNHPELSTWIMDWPNPDDRCFRATRRRFHAFRDMIEAYWRGAFHPRALGTLTAENAYLDRGFAPAPSPPAGLMDPQRGPLGTPQDIFQTNFAFGRAVRLYAQAIDPGYWQASHPDEDGYRPDQIMRYSEANLNRLQIAGEIHVKSGKPLDADRAPGFNQPIDWCHLTTEASWEDRGQMCRTSARDFVEALLLDIHHARYLQQHPHVTVKDTLLQDQLLGDAEETLRRHGGEETLARLKEEARQSNLDASNGRFKTDWIEPETLFWSAWSHLPPEEKAALAHEVVSHFLTRVHEAHSADPRLPKPEDPLAWHRHRIHPVLWQALEATATVRKNDPVAKELAAWQSHREQYLTRRPNWSPLKKSKPPWD